MNCTDWQFLFLQVIISIGGRFLHGHLLLLPTQLLISSFQNRAQIRKYLHTGKCAGATRSASEKTKSKRRVSNTEMCACVFVRLLLCTAQTLALSVSVCPRTSENQKKWPDDISKHKLKAKIHLNLMLGLFGELIRLPSGIYFIQCFFFQLVYV